MRIRKDKPKILEAFQRLGQIQKNNKITQSKLFKVLQDDDEELLESLNVQELEQLDQTWDSLILFSPLLEFYKILKDRQINEEAIDQLTIEEQDIEENYKVSFQQLSYLQRFLNVFDQPLSNLKSKQSTLEDFLKDLQYNLDTAQKDKNSFTTIFTEMSQKDFQKSFQHLLDDRKNSQRETDNILKTCLTNSLYYFKHDNQTFDYTLEILPAKSLKVEILDQMARVTDAEELIIKQCFKESLRANYTSLQRTVINSRIYLKQSGSDQLLEKKNSVERMRCVINIYDNIKRILKLCSQIAQKGYTNPLKLAFQNHMERCNIKIYFRGPHDFIVILDNMDFDTNC